VGGWKSNEYNIMESWLTWFGLPILEGSSVNKALSLRDFADDRHNSALSKSDGVANQRFLSAG